MAGVMSAHAPRGKRRGGGGIGERSTRETVCLPVTEAEGRARGVGAGITRLFNLKLPDSN